MNYLRFTRTGCPLLVGIFATVWGVWCTHAFPPAPHHVIHGLVRNEYGEPLSLSTAQVFLETTNGITVACQVSPDIQPGENYRLIVPMDLLNTVDPYKPTALQPLVGFRLKVQIGETVYVPIEMAGNLSTLGQPAGETLANLTLGVDSDGDGIPDAWENLLIQILGGGLTLADVTPNSDNDGDGVSNYEEYLAGTYPWDPTDGAAAEGLRLGIIRRNAQGPVLEFLSTAGRTYSVLGTTNLTTWTPMSIRVPPGATGVPGSLEYLSPASEIIEVEVLVPPPESRAMLFRVRVQ
jgi:hypothetical protein